MSGMGLSGLEVPATPTPSVQRATGWAGWVPFAGTMLVLLGGFQIIWGLAALLNEDFFVLGSDGLPLEINYTALGWIHLVGGALMVVIGLGIYAAKTWARVSGIIVVMLAAIVDFVGLGTYPLWSAIMIAVQVLAIYALAVHGNEITKVGRPL